MIRIMPINIPNDETMRAMRDADAGRGRRVSMDELRKIMGL